LTGAVNKRESRSPLLRKISELERKEGAQKPGLSEAGYNRSKDEAYVIGLVLRKLGRHAVTAYSGLIYRSTGSTCRRSGGGLCEHILQKQAWEGDADVKLPSEFESCVMDRRIGATEGGGHHAFFLRIDGKDF